MSDLRLRLAAGFVVGGTGRLERSAGIVELLPVVGVVLGLRLDATGLALQVVQQTRVTAGAPFVVPIPTTGIALRIGHRSSLVWLSA